MTPINDEKRVIKNARKRCRELGLAPKEDYLKRLRPRFELPERSESSLNHNYESLDDLDADLDDADLDAGYGYGSPGKGDSSSSETLNESATTSRLSPSKLVKTRLEPLPKTTSNDSEGHNLNTIGDSMTTPPPRDSNS